MIQNLNKLASTSIIVIAALIFCFESAKADEITTYIQQKFNTLEILEDTRPPYDLFERGIIGYYNLKANGKKVLNEKLTLIDFRITSKKKRMWVIDMTTNKVIYFRLVAHGKNTGEEFAKSFSNIRNSNKSSLGFYLTGENYQGKHGLSLRLDGMEEGFNDEARARAIVMHSANYVSREFINRNGRLGRSFGCPAIAINKHKEIISGLANKSVLFIYANNENYNKESLLFNKERAKNYLIKQKIIAKSEEV